MIMMENGQDNIIMEWHCHIPRICTLFNNFMILQFFITIFYEFFGGKSKTL